MTLSHDGVNTEILKERTALPHGGQYTLFIYAILDTAIIMIWGFFGPGRASRMLHDHKIS